MKISKEDKKLINIIKSVIISKNKIDLKKKKNIIRLYQKIKKEIESNEFTSYDINNLFSRHKNDSVVNFLKGLTQQYNNILVDNLSKYKFRECNEIKGFCHRSKIRGFTKVRDQILNLAKKRLDTWEGCWSFVHHHNCKIKGIKLIDPDIINYITKNVT